jgi:hypothetical protein
MLAFLLALFGSFLATLGARGMYLMAHLSVALRQARPLLLCGLFAGALAAGVAAYIGARAAAILPPVAVQILASLAFALAAFALPWKPRGGLPAEPTRSLFAIASVLTMRQLAGAAGLFLAAAAMVSGEAVQVAAGGALGSGGAMALCWARPQWMGRGGQFEALRKVLAALLVAAAIWNALAAMGIV